MSKARIINEWNKAIAAADAANERGDYAAFAEASDYAAVLAFMMDA